MTTGVPLHLAVEDALQEAVLRRLLAQLERSFHVGSCFRRGGFGYLRKTIGGFNQASRGVPFLVLTDLDAGICPSQLIAEWLQRPRHANLIFRVAVRAVESWVLADREAFSGFLGVRLEEIPSDVDSIENPKRFLIDLARGAKRRVIREGLVPARGSTAKVGPEYNGYLGEFVATSWDVASARRCSASLDRCAAALSRFVPE